MLRGGWFVVRDMRRATTSVLMAVLVLVGLAAAPALAGAAPRASAPAVCPNSGNYPPSIDATVASSTTTPRAGATIEASGSGYCSDEDVTLTIDGAKVGTAHTDGNGSFDPPVVVPGPAGDKQLCGIGASGLAADSDCLTLHVTAATAAAQSTGGSNGGTAFTGTRVLLLLVIALALLGGGAAFVTAGRRKQSAGV